MGRIPQIRKQLVSDSHPTRELQVENYSLYIANLLVTKGRLLSMEQVGREKLDTHGSPRRTKNKKISFLLYTTTFSSLLWSVSVSCISSLELCIYVLHLSIPQLSINIKLLPSPYSRLPSCFLSFLHLSTSIPFTFFLSHRLRLGYLL